MEKFLFEALGYFAILLGVISFTQENREKMLIFNIFSTLFYGINILYYNGYTGAILSFISIIIMIISFKYKHKLNYKFHLISPILAIIVFLIIDEGIVGLLPAIGTFFSTLANLQKNILYMKYIFYGSATSWLIYGIYLGSVPAILLDVAGIIALTYGIYKIKKKNSTN